MPRLGKPSLLKGFLFILLVLALVLGFAVWRFSIPLPVDEERLNQAQNNDKFSLVEQDTALVLEPSKPTGQGLLFVPGARVSADSYVWNLSPLAEQGITVVITKPRLGFAILDTRQPEAFTDGIGGVDRWAVGGHSLGGVKACAWVADAPDTFDALYLAGSYCSNDASGFTGQVLSLRGSQDGLTEATDVEETAHLLPTSAKFVTIEGMNHGQFGSYGPQKGDLPATITNEQARNQSAALLIKLITLSEDTASES